MMRLRFTWIMALAVGAAASLSSAEAAAAKEIALGATYDMRVPVGSLRRLMPSASFNGFQARWDFFPRDALSAGLEVQYNLFQRGLVTATVPIANGDVTATTFRYASQWSFLPTVRYYLFPRSAFRPYAELAAGVTVLASAVLVSDLPQRDRSTAFILQPSAGVLWRLTPDTTSRASDGSEAGVGPVRKPLESMFGLTASVTYAYSTADIFGASDISHAGIQLGIYAKP
jgi:hypothetical protein